MHILSKPLHILKTGGALPNPLPKVRMQPMIKTQEMVIVSAAKECVVCYEPTVDFVKPCTHPLCAKCAYKWFEKKTVCPMCIEVPCGFSVRRPVQLGGRDITIPTTPLGVTLINQSGKVIVKTAYEYDTAFKNGVRPGDIILFVNDIPASSHEKAISVIKSAERNGVSVVLSVEAPSSKRKKTCPWGCFILSR